MLETDTFCKDVVRVKNDLAHVRFSRSKHENRNAEQILSDIVEPDYIYADSLFPNGFPIEKILELD